MESSRLRVLLAESGLTEAGLTLRSLCAETGRTLELVYVTNRDSLPRALRDFRPDVALLSLSLLQPDPPTTVYSLHQSLPHIPLILFADLADKELAIACLQVGATDYMLEGFMDERTLSRALQAALRAPDGLALPRDPQTFPDPVPGAIPPVLLSVQLTNFESLRAVEGALVADGALQRVAVQLQKCVRRGDRIAHVAPDKFLVVVADSCESSLLAVHRRITSRFRPENQLCAPTLALSVHYESCPCAAIPSGDSASIASSAALQQSHSPGSLP